MRILVVEDDRTLNAQLGSALRDAGYVVDSAFDGEEGHFLGDTEPYDAVVLDIGLPQMDGLSVLEEWRRAGKSMPVLLLTARDEIAARVAGLDAGADDYLAKPFALEELQARLRALLRRGTGSDTELLSYGDLSMNTLTHEVRRGGLGLELTRTEFELLRMFLEHPRQVLTRTQIFERVWGFDFGRSSNSLEVYVGYLRRKLEADGEPRVLQTVRGVGYALRCE